MFQHFKIGQLNKCIWKIFQWLINKILRLVLECRVKVVNTMIVDRAESHFIFVFHYDHIYKRYNYINYQGKTLTNKEYLEHWGKFGIFGTVEEHFERAKKLDSYVEKKAIPCIKFDRVPVEKLQLKECVM